MSTTGNFDTAAPDGGARQVRNRQIVLFCILAAALLTVFAVWLAASGGKAPAPVARIAAELAGPGTAEDSWTRRSEGRLGHIETRLREMQAQSRRLDKENTQLRAQLRKTTENGRAVVDRMTAVIARLERGAGPPGAPAKTLAPPGGNPFTGAGRYARGPKAGPKTGSRTARAPTAPLIESFALDGPVLREPEGEEAKPLSRWLPAGSHAEAVVLAGVDASAGIASQGDPRPVLLRITGPAWTAADNGTARMADLAGCTVTGAAHGDLSSEKIYARLRTMTCAGKAPGTVIETQVAGFIAGAGKTGVRGPVVSREGALVEKAFLAGLVSGVGQGVARAFQPQAALTGGAGAVAGLAGTSLAGTGLADIGRGGLGSGASSAGQKVADYMIRRAEQYQPVIQLRAGTRVTVVFIAGARLDGRPQKPARNRAQNRK